MAQVLGVWMNGEPVGTWSSRGGAGSSFRYDPAWLSSPASRALSLSLPITLAKLGEIHARHWRALAERAGLPQAMDGLIEMAAGMAQTLERVGSGLPDGFAAQVWDKTRRGVLRHAAQFQRELG